MKSTSGPWNWTGPYETGGYKINFSVSMGGVYVEPGENTEANARLIASSPDLLAACKLALPFLEEYRERVIKGEITGRLLTGDYGSVNDVRRAIAKAEVTP
jgi:hypothetical protein